MFPSTSHLVNDDITCRSLEPLAFLAMAVSINYIPIPDLITKARSTLQRSQPTPSLSNSSGSSSSTQKQRARLENFFGQIIACRPLIHSGSHGLPIAPYSHLSSISQLEDPPLLRRAIKMFDAYKKQTQEPGVPEASLDYIVWVGPAETRNSRKRKRTRSRSRSKTRHPTPARRTRDLSRSTNTENSPRKTTSPQVILVPDSDEESSREDRILQERNHGIPSSSTQGFSKRRLSCDVAEESDGSMDDRHIRDASTVSWSDSYAGSGSEHDSEEEEIEPFQSHRTFQKVVSVILSQSHQTQDGEGHVIKLDTVRTGDQIRVHNAVMLVQESQPEKSESRVQGPLQESRTDEIVVSCLGVSGKTTFTILRPDHVQIAQKPETITPTSSAASSQTATSGSLKQVAKKRCIASSVIAQKDLSNGFSLQQQMEQLQQEYARIQEQYPLELLVRKRPLLHDPKTQHKTETSAQEVSPERVSIPPVPPCFATLWSANIPGATRGDTNKDEEELTILDIVCRKTRLQSAMVRAVCAECGNDYKDLRCTFGCRSMTWSIFVKLICEISDGTANAMLEVEGMDDNDNSSSAFQSKEDMMWTLLGLSRKSCQDQYTYENQVAAFEEVKNRVLQVLARRGEFSYAFDPKKTSAVVPATQPSKSKKQGSRKAMGSGQTTSSTGTGSVSSIGLDHTERAKAEEQLWLDVCSGVAGNRDPNQHYILHATLDKTSQSNHRPLQTTRIPIGRQFFQTLTPPPLILRATYVQRVTPFALCDRLTQPKKQ